MIDLRRLRYFLEVADTLHFTRAARALGVSQQPLSRAIGELETELGIRLFERTTRQVALTPAGEALAEHGLLALQQLALAERAARSAGRPSLRVVYPGTVAGLPHSAVGAFRVAHDVDVTFGLVRSWEQERLLLRGEADVAFVVPPTHDPRLASRTLVRVPMRVAMRRDDALAKKRGLRMNDLRDARWVTYSRRTKPALWELLRQLSAAAGFTPRRNGEAGDEMEAARLVAAGQGMALVSEGARAGRELLLRRLAERPRIEIAAVWRASDRRPLVAAWIEALGRACAELPGGLAP